MSLLVFLTRRRQRRLNSYSMHIWAGVLSFFARFSSRTESMSAVKRGALIVLEGCDRSGKTSQAKRLHEQLVKDGEKCILLRFPDRTTPIGNLIDQYLRKTVQMEDHVIHQLFSANRWECAQMIKNKLNEGVTILIDRYAYSGVAFSAAKKGMELGWCKQCDVGLPYPDMVLFLDITPEEAAKRAGFGDERYERLKFQKKVYSNYLMLKDKNWKFVKANRSFDAVQKELLALVRNMIKSLSDSKISTLWTS